MTKVIDWVDASGIPCQNVFSSTRYFVARYQEQQNRDMTVELKIETAKFWHQFESQVTLGSGARRQKLFMEQEIEVGYQRSRERAVSSRGWPGYQETLQIEWSLLS